MQTCQHNATARHRVAPTTNRQRTPDALYPEAGLPHGSPDGGTNIDAPQPRQCGHRKRRRHACHRETPTLPGCGHRLHTDADWPEFFPPQTHLQESIHDFNARQRDHLIAVLANSPNAKQNKQALRMAHCSNAVELTPDTENNQVHQWIARCRHPLCPTCAARRAIQLRKQIARLIDLMPRPRTIVLTTRSSNEPLGVQLSNLRTWYQKLRRHPDWKARVKGGLATLEITNNRDTGMYHPHLHIIYTGEFFPVAVLRNAWHEITGHSHVVWIEDVKSASNAAAELAKYIAKPGRLTQWPDEIIVDYATATSGRRFFSTFGTLFNAKLDEADDNPKPTSGACPVNLFAIVRQALLGDDLAQTLILKIAERWHHLRTYIFTLMPLLETPMSKERRKAIARARILGEAPPRSEQPTNARDPADIEAEIVPLLIRFHEEDTRRRDEYLDNDPREKALQV